MCEGEKEENMFQSKSKIMMENGKALIDFPVIEKKNHF